MVVRKSGTPVSAKKKSVEEMKKLNEKKKMMMKEESEEEEDTSEEGEEEEDSGSDNDILDSGEGSAEDDDDDDDDDEEDDEEEEESDDESEEEPTIPSPKKPSKEQIQTPAKSPKTPNKQSLQASSQKSEAQSSKKTPNKKKNLMQNDSSLITSPKKTGRTEDDSAKAPSPSKQQKEISPVKGTAEKRKREGGEEEGTMKKSRIDPPANSSAYSEERRQRDRRCLFIKLFPKGTTEDEIKALSKDIMSVRFPGKRNKGFAFIEFASEEKAEENFSILERSKMKGQKLYVDYVGEKSQKYHPVPHPKPENKKRLFLSGVPSAATMEDIGKHFPHAVAMLMRSSGSNRLAYVDFETEAAGEEALKQNSALKIKGHAITVMYSNKAKKKPTKGKASKQGQQKATARKQRGEKKKMEEEEEDEDDDDDDDDDSEEEGSGDDSDEE